MAKKKKRSADIKSNPAGQESKTNIVKTKPRVTSSTNTPTSSALVFGKENFKWVGIGLLLIALGMLLMIGGYNENHSVWDESKIYGFQRTLLAPILILSGLATQIYAIFK